MWAHAQVGLTDMLHEEYGIVPAGFVGHSAGEIACAYADGGLSREQVSLFWRHCPAADACPVPTVLRAQHSVSPEESDPLPVKASAVFDPA
jgi:hypothetical protein